MRRSVMTTKDAKGAGNSMTKPLATILEFPKESPAHHLQFQETQRALVVADAVAVAAFQKPTTGDLDPSAASLCRLIATHALRSVSQSWSDAAAEHAADACLQILRKLTLIEDEEIESDLARLLTAAVLAAHHAILDGTICLQPEEYLKIAKGER